MTAYTRQTNNYVWSPDSDRVGHGATSTVYRCRDKVTRYILLFLIFILHGQLEKQNIQGIQNMEDIDWFGQ